MQTNLEILDRIQYVKTMCDEVLDEYNAKGLTYEQMKARMELLVKLLQQLESKSNE